MPAAEGALASGQEEERTEFKLFSRDIRALICVGGLTCRAAVPDGVDQFPWVKPVPGGVSVTDCTDE